MFCKVAILVGALVLACEARIEIPGLENIQKCAKNDEACVRFNSDLISKAISKPFPKYSIKGYDPIVVDHLTMDTPDYQVTQYFKDMEVTGLGDTKTISGKLEEKNNEKTVTVEYEQSIKFAAKGKAVFHLQPEITREGPISGEFGGLKTRVSYPVKVVEKGGQRYLEIGQQTILGVEMPNMPMFNLEQFQKFTSGPEVAEVVKKILANSQSYHKVLAEAIIAKVTPQFFEDKRSFYKNVPISEFERN